MPGGDQSKDPQPAFQATVEDIEDEGDLYVGFGSSGEVFEDEQDYHAEHREYIAADHGESNPFIVDDADEAYLSVRPRLGDGSESDDPVVAEECMPIRTLCAWVNGVSLTECILNPGCSIVAISEEKAHEVGLAYEHTKGRSMQSANSAVNTTLGVAEGVPLELAGGILCYVRMHVVRNAPYDVLLGRPFDALMETEVETDRSGHQIMRVRCPNTKRQLTVPTYDRGRAPRAADNKTLPRGFRSSRT